MEISVDYKNKTITFTGASLEELAMALFYDYPEEEYGDFEILIAE